MHLDALLRVQNIHEVFIVLMKKQNLIIMFHYYKITNDIDIEPEYFYEIG